MQQINDDESQALQLRKAAEVLANISVNQRNRAAIAIQDSQLIIPGWRVHENELQSQTPQKAFYTLGSNAERFPLNMISRFS